MHMTQLSLSFEPGLTTRFKTLHECIAASVLMSRAGVSGVAAKIDMGHSELSKRINSEASDPRPLRIEDMVRIMEATGDYQPIYWLIERFLQDDDAADLELRAKIKAFLPDLIAYVQHDQEKARKRK